MMRKCQTVGHTYIGGRRYLVRAGSWQGGGIVLRLHGAAASAASRVLALEAWIVQWRAVRRRQAEVAEFVAWQVGGR